MRASSRRPLTLCIVGLLMIAAFYLRSEMVSETVVISPIRADANYCILRYNAYKAPAPVQLVLYTGIAAVAAIINITIFLILRGADIADEAAILGAFFPAALLDYLLCVGLLFRHQARWASVAEAFWYLVIVSSVLLLDFSLTCWLLDASFSPFLSKSVGCLVGMAFNFIGRRYIVFPEPPAGPWKSTIAQ
jgi:putative flippase GtrA